MLRPHLGERAGKDAGGGHGQHAQSEGTFARVADDVQLFVEPFQFRQYTARRIDQSCPGRGRLHAAGMSIEQFRLSDILRFVKGLAESRLREIESGGRLQQASM